MAIGHGGIEQCIDRVSDAILSHYVAIDESARNAVVIYRKELPVSA